MSAHATQFVSSVVSSNQSSTVTGSADQWFADTGATHHVTPNVASAQQSTDYSGPDKGQQVTAAGLEQFTSPSLRVVSQGARQSDTTGQDLPTRTVDSATTSSSRQQVAVAPLEQSDIRPEVVVLPREVQQAVDADMGVVVS
ncbi:hypothetical protein V6N13_009792 [Hibiscus sabdariffa]